MSKALALFAIVVFCWAFFGMHDKYWPIWMSALVSLGVTGIAVYVFAIPMMLIAKLCKFFKEED